MFVAPRYETHIHFLIDAYRLLLSPFFGQQCRFCPTCSSSAKEAIERYGALHDDWLGVPRIRANDRD